MKKVIKVFKEIALGCTVLIVLMIFILTAEAITGTDLSTGMRMVTIVWDVYIGLRIIEITIN